MVVVLDWKPFETADARQAPWDFETPAPGTDEHGLGVGKARQNRTALRLRNGFRAASYTG